MRPFSPLFLVPVLVVACGHSEPAVAPTTAVTAASAPPATTPPVLELAEVKIESTGPKHGAGALHADGRLEMDGKTVLTLTSDGRALDATGNELTRIDATGKVGTKGISVDSDGTVRAADGKTFMQLSADGTIGFEGKTAPIKVTVSDAKARRAIMFAFVVLQGVGTNHVTMGPGCPSMKGSHFMSTPDGCSCDDTNNGKKYEVACDDTGKTPCVCKTDGKKTATVPAAKQICGDQTVWAKCGFPEHVEEVKPQF